MNRRTQLLELMSKRSRKWTGSKHVGFEDKLAAALILVEGAGLSSKLEAAGIQHAIVGGIAAIHWGSPRTTSDIDYLIKEKDLGAALAAFEPHSEPQPIAIGGASIDTAGGTTVDLLCPDEPWVQGALDTARQTKHGLTVSPPYLVLMKMVSSRGAQEDMDMAHVLKHMGDTDLQLTKKLVARFLPNDVDDFETLIEIGKLL